MPRRIDRLEIQTELHPGTPMIPADTLPGKHPREDQPPGAIPLPHDRVRRIAPERLPDKDKKRLDGYGAFVLRIALGGMFIAHAALKVFVFTVPGTVLFFQSVGLPGVLAFAVIAAEAIGGVLLVLGIATRAVSLALVPILLGAAWVHLPNGWVFSAPNGGWEYPVFLAFAAVAQALLGAGALALTGRPAAAAHPA